jgi:peptidyl-prolyl cis-trans isomerase D
MLDKIRNNVAHNQVIRGSLILITLAFVFWGMGIQSLSFFSKNYAIKAGNVEISATDYNRAYQMAVARTQQQLGGQKLPDSFMEQINKQTQATTTASLTNQALLEAYASSENIFVDDKTIYQILEVTPSFQKDGKFDKETYKAVLRNYNFSPIEYEEMLVKQVQANMIEILFNQTATVS